MGELDDLPIVETIVPNLFVVPAGKIPLHPSKLLRSARMREFLDLAKSRFGLIIINSPPLMSVTDAAILSAQAEGVLLVVKAESVPRKAAMDARDQLLEVNATLLGAVFNNIQTQRDGYFCNSYYPITAITLTIREKMTASRPATAVPPSPGLWLSERSG